MEFLLGVAGHAVHIALEGMNISLAPFAHVFVTHPAAVASGTLFQDGRPFIEVVAVHKPATHVFGPAYMAAAAAGMAVAAVAFLGHVQMGIVAAGAAGHDGGKGGQGKMKGLGDALDDFIMAVAAGVVQIVERGLGNHTFMGGGLVLGISIACVAFGAAHLAVFGIGKLLGYHNLFLWRQRRHRAASAGSGGHGRFLGLFLAQVLDEFFLAGMAVDAALIRPGGADKRHAQQQTGNAVKQESELLWEYHDFLLSMERLWIAFHRKPGLDCQ